MTPPMDDAGMRCQDFVELVTDYLEQALSGSDRLRFESHFDDCPYCDSYLDQMRQTIALTGHLSEETLSPEIKAEMLRRFRDWTR
jgi:anti-sigma factor RsiW